MSRQALPPKQANVDTGHQILPGLAQGSFQRKELDRTTKAIAQINADRKVEKAQYAEFNAPTCDKIAVWQLCKERQPFCKSHDLWWPELKMFGSMPQCSFLLHKLLRASELLYSSLNLIDEFTSLFLPKMIYAGSLRKAASQKHAFVDISVFLWLTNNGQVLPTARPRVIFGWKNFIEQLKHILKWMLIEKWRRPSMLSSMCQHVARLQFDSCPEKHSLCGTVIMDDGQNLRCLDQFHCVRSKDTSSFQDWRKRIAVHCTV